MFSEALRESVDLSLFWDYREVMLSGLAFNFHVFAASASAAIEVVKVPGVGGLEVSVSASVSATPVAR